MTRLQAFVERVIGELAGYDMDGSHAQRDAARAVLGREVRAFVQGMINERAWNWRDVPDAWLDENNS